jgi:methyltransferase (TIGR00027 family)
MTMQNPIARTAYYTLAVRNWDAAQPKPVCGDSLAATFMNEEAEGVWHQFKRYHRANASNAARHAIIDEHLSAVLEARPQALVIVIGAGFDTRAFRLQGGRWIEVDEPGILSYKESRLPAAGAPNRLTRVPIAFSRESLAERLAPFAGEDSAHVIIEGVLMYLTQSQREELIATLQKLFPNHVVYCDLMRKSFFERYSRDLHEQIAGMGATFRDMSESPEKLFTDAGYRKLACTSIPLRAAEAGTLDIPAFLVKWVLGTLRNGYCICKFGPPK